MAISPACLFLSMLVVFMGIPSENGSLRCIRLSPFEMKELKNLDQRYDVIHQERDAIVHVSTNQSGCHVSGTLCLLSSMFALVSIYPC